MIDLIQTVKRLRANQGVSDERFDMVYPDPIHRLSTAHWTPVRVARRAAELLVTKPGTKVLDVGSGSGKFCIIGALTTEGVFTGIEQRDYLVELSRSLAQRFLIERAHFIHGNMMGLDWSEYDSFYLYNPFVENMYDEASQIDNDVAQTWFCYEKYVHTVRRKLLQAPAGTRVVTYHGFGGDFPPGYSCVLREPIGSDKLDVWVKD